MTQDFNARDAGSGTRLIDPLQGLKQTYIEDCQVYQNAIAIPERWRKVIAAHEVVEPAMKASV